MFHSVYVSKKMDDWVINVNGWVTELINQLVIQEIYITDMKGMFLTSSVLLQLPKGPQQAFVALVAFVILGIHQDLLDINEQTGDSGVVRREKGRLN